MSRVDSEDDSMDRRAVAFVVSHRHALGPATFDDKMIGVFESVDAANAAISKLSSQPGFAESPEGFVVTELRIGRLYWPQAAIELQ